MLLTHCARSLGLHTQTSSILRAFLDATEAAVASDRSEEEESPLTSVVPVADNVRRRGTNFSACEAAEGATAAEADGEVPPGALVAGEGETETVREDGVGEAGAAAVTTGTDVVDDDVAAAVAVATGAEAEEGSEEVAEIEGREPVGGRLDILNPERPFVSLYSDT